MKKVLLVIAITFSISLFGMQRFVVQPAITQVVAACSLPAFKQTIKNYSSNTPVQYAIQPYNYEGIFPYDAVRDAACIRNCIIHTHDNLFCLGNYSDEEKLQNAQKCIHSMSSDPDSHVFVIRTAGNSVGYIWYIHDKNIFANSAYIAQRGVLQEYRGLGLGKKLMNYAEQKLLEDPDLTVIELKRTKPILEDVYFKMGYQNITPEGATSFLYQKRVRSFSLRMKKMFKLGACIFAGMCEGYYLYEKNKNSII